MLSAASSKTVSKGPACLPLIREGPAGTAEAVKHHSEVSRGTVAFASTRDEPFGQRRDGARFGRSYSLKPESWELRPAEHQLGKVSRPRCPPSLPSFRGPSLGCRPGGRSRRRCYRNVARQCPREAERLRSEGSRCPSQASSPPPGQSQATVLPISPLAIR